MNFAFCVWHTNTLMTDSPVTRVFTVTVTSYIWITQILKLHMETTSTYKGRTSCPSFSRLLHSTSGLLCYTCALPKILHQLHLTLLTTLGLWGAPF